MYARNNKYRTMRRNARKYQPKHLKIDVMAARIYRRIWFEALIVAIATFFASLALILCIHFIAQNEIIAAQPQNQITGVSTPIKSEPVVVYEDVVRVSSSYTKIFVSPYDIVTTDYTLETLEAEFPTKTVKTIESVEPTEPETKQLTLQDFIGDNVINFDGAKLTRYDLPSKYYGNIDFSSFQPFMCYTAITNKSAPAYHVVNSEQCYTDEYGLRRYSTTSDQFTINGQDDYLIALGTYYKEKGVVGNRYLIVTENGMYTARTGDEKSDNHTDDMHMFTVHSDGKCAGIIEWIVDYDNLNSTIATSGTVTRGGPEVLKGEILHIYSIDQ